eukprot:TRINITY_DN5550_c0_g2_i1.p1 TRINITY_DN5550_c0_g2~~TRINITY_DN5550_c0_g2_i1.p1  ORF type:complete len:342 (+),score=125.93 TRINITY_DN5550_c0_g2_i1:66-1091(+)
MHKQEMGLACGMVALATGVAAGKVSANEQIVIGSCTFGLGVVIMYLMWVWRTKGKAFSEPLPLAEAEEDAAVPAAAKLLQPTATKKRTRRGKKAKQPAVAAPTEAEPVAEAVEEPMSIVEAVEPVLKTVKEESVSALAVAAALTVLADAGTVLSAQLSAGRDMAPPAAPCAESADSVHDTVEGVEWEGMPQLLDEAYMSFYGDSDVLKEDEEEEAMRSNAQYWVSPFAGKAFALVEEDAVLSPDADAAVSQGGRSRSTWASLASKVVGEKVALSAMASSAASLSWGHSSDLDILEADSDCNASDSCERSLLDENDVFASKCDTVTCGAMFDSLLGRAQLVA